MSFLTTQQHHQRSLQSNRVTPLPVLRHNVLAPYQAQSLAVIHRAAGAASNRSDSAVCSQRAPSAAVLPRTAHASQGATMGNDGSMGSFGAASSSVPTRCAARAAQEAHWGVGSLSQHHTGRSSATPSSIAGGTTSNGIGALGTATACLEAGVAAASALRQRRRQPMNDDAASMPTENGVLAELRAATEALHALAAASLAEQHTLQRLCAALTNESNLDDGDAVGLEVEEGTACPQWDVCDGAAFPRSKRRQRDDAV